MAPDLPHLYRSSYNDYDAWLNVERSASGCSGYWQKRSLVNRIELELTPAREYCE